MSFTIQAAKLEILKLFAAAPQHGGHKFNLLGKPYQPGGLEHALGIIFDKEQRALAAQAFDQLKHDGLIRSTLSDLADPENWCEITDAGHQSVAQGVLDDLDAVLMKINPHLIDIRRGAWSAWLEPA